MIFIIGNSRSGTTLMAKILGQHPSIHITGEAHFMEEFSFERNHFDTLSEDDKRNMINRLLTIFRKTYYRKAKIEFYPETETIFQKFINENEDTFAQLISVIFEYEASRHGKKIVGDQTPRHIFYINEIKAMFPDAKFIHMVRDPRAVLLSQKYKWKALAQKGVPLLETIRTFLNYHPILMSWLWKKGVINALNATNYNQSDSWIDVKFEDLTNNPEVQIKNICSCLTVDFSKTMLDVSVSLSSTNTDEGKKGISKNMCNKWIKGLTDNEKYISEKINKDLMQKYSYIPQSNGPSFLKLIIIFLVLPFQLIIILFFNFNRMGNPINFIKKRIK